MQLPAPSTTVERALSLPLYRLLGKVRRSNWSAIWWLEPLGAVAGSEPSLHGPPHRGDPQEWRPALVGCAKPVRWTSIDARTTCYRIRYVAFVPPMGECIFEQHGTMRKSRHVFNPTA